MAIVKVNRPKLRWYEHLFLPALLKGLGITLKHAIGAVRGRASGGRELASSGLGVTMQYPEQKWGGFMIFVGGGGPDGDFCGPGVGFGGPGFFF